MTLGECTRQSRRDDRRHFIPSSIAIFSGLLDMYVRRTGWGPNFLPQLPFPLPLHSSSPLLNPIADSPSLLPHFHCPTPFPLQSFSPIVLLPSTLTLPLSIPLPRTLHTPLPLTNQPPTQFPVGQKPTRSPLIFLPDPGTHLA